MNFTDFNFHESLAEGLDSMGFSTPTPIQAESIPLIQAKEDLIACAQTGTGKTAAYLLPVMDMICKLEKRPAISALILAPTRELAIQIDQQVEGLAYFTGLSSIAIYGGGDGIGYEQQRRSLRDGVDIVIATPGRLIAHLTSGLVRFGDTRFLVLDEADRMLDMGFKDDINRIVRELPGQRQTVMFSATMPPKIRAFAKTLLLNPKQVNIALSQPAEKILQQQYRIRDEDKIRMLEKILSAQEYSSVIVFSSTKDKVKDVYKALKKMGVGIQAFHSDLSQNERERLLLQFRNRELPVLVGTDVLSRGIDIEGIDLVVNFDVPPDPEDYIHRIGRTARAERTGTAITFVNNKDLRRFASIERLMERAVDVVALPEGMEAPSESRSSDHDRSARRGSDRRGQGRNSSRKGSSRNASSKSAPQSPARKPPVNGASDTTVPAPVSVAPVSVDKEITATDPVKLPKKRYNRPNRNRKTKETGNEN